MRCLPLVCGLCLVVAAEVSLSGVALNRPVAVSQIPRDSWKDCLYNEAIMRCIDLQSADQLKIVWRDADGGLWRRELMLQGNTLLTNLSTGNRIPIPLRFPCKPPLKGEVGYCYQ